MTGMADGEGRAVGVVVAKFNGEITSRLLERALEELESAGVPRESVTIVPVPGAFELPLVAMALAKTRQYACIVARLRGARETSIRLVARGRRGLARGNRDRRPVAFALRRDDRAGWGQNRPRR
jgi:6,7-dimethyl-8-ribityllumazine synthase